MSRFRNVSRWGLRLLVTVAILANIFGIFGPGSASADTWYNASWLYRKKITVNAASGASSLTNFPVLISISADAPLGTHAQLDGDDILFTSNDKLTKLDHEIESFSSNGATATLTAWVRIPTLSNSATTDIYMYYGNSSASSQQNKTGVWDSNYRMVQHMEESSGGTNAVTDSTTNSNNGTDSGSPTFGASGKIDGAINFDNTDDRVMVGYGTNLGTTRPLTIEAWIRPTAVPVGNTSEPIIFRDNGTNMNYSLSIASGTYTGGAGAKILFWREDAADTDNKTYGTTTLSAGNWYHIVAIDDGTQGASGTMSIYVNGGAAEGVITANGFTAYDSATHKTVIADTNGETIGSGHFFNGIIDEVRVSSAARSTGWIQTSYSNQNNPSGFITVGLEENNFTLPVVTTLAVSVWTADTATMSSNITDNGGDDSNTYFAFEWGTASGVYTANTSWVGPAPENTLLQDMSSSFSPGTLYYMRAMAKNSAGIGYGSEQTFLMYPIDPSGFNITASSGTSISGAWTKGAGADNTLIRRKAAAAPADRTDGDLVYYGPGTTFTDTTVAPGVAYLYRAWSQVADGSYERWTPDTTYVIAVGDTYDVASIATLDATLIDETATRLNGQIIEDYGVSCSYAFEWGTASGVYTDNSTWLGSIIGDGTLFNYDVAGLQRGTVYYYRAIVKGWNAEVSYGSELHFLTKPAAPTGFSATVISDTQIDFAWTMGDGAGRMMIRARTDTYPTSPTDGTEIYFGTGTSFSALTLTPGTTYYFSAWSEKTGSQQWSNIPVQATATTTGFLPPAAVGGRVFSINKALLLAPWFALAVGLLLFFFIVILHIARGYYRCKDKNLFIKHLKAITGRRRAFK